MQRSSNVTARVGEHFRRKAFSFDRLYEEDHVVQRLLRPGLFRRRELAVSEVRRYEDPRVLDVGCGSGRIAEHVLQAGASRYVGIDLSEPMLDLARERLSPWQDRIELVQGDFLTEPLEGQFDVVLGLGLFDYVEEATTFARRIGELCSGSVVASFPAWTWLKGPIRKLRYEVINNCPIFDYTEPGLRSLWTSAGFEHVEVLAPGKSGFLVVARR